MADEEQPKAPPEDEVLQEAVPEEPPPEASSAPEREEDEGSGAMVSLAVGGTNRWGRVKWGLATAAAVGLLVGIAVAAPSVSVPLLVAFIIAYLLDPVVDWFEARKMSRTLAIVIILGAFLGVIGLISLFVIPQVVRELAQIPAKIREAAGQAIPWIETTFAVQLPHTLDDTLDTIHSQMNELKVSSASAAAGKMLKGAYGQTMGLLALLAGLVMVPVFAFYLLREFDHIIADINGLIPKSYRPSIAARFREIDQAMSSFIRGQITVAMILAVLYSAGLLVVGLPLALVVGMLAGVGNMVPYLGTAIGIGLAAVLCVLSGEGWPIFIKVAVVFALVQGLEGWVLTPKVVGESVGLSPFAVIVAVLLFGELFGFVGVLIAVPLAAVVKILLRVALESYRASAFYAR